MSKPVEKQEWFRIAEAFEASGLMQQEFSRQRGLRLNRGGQSWVYRRRQAGEGHTAPMSLLPVEVARMPAATELRVEVVTASGARVHFAVGADVECVARFVAALGR
ncbi:IS66 family insertion sequence element accessory protein TnpA [Myxococcus virescens]|uniref:IS66 family insertion sequence element accessory protein TnpA n=1 Tax=Myxococcus virescens TaxID=83456 RepID=UPI003DA217F7